MEQQNEFYISMCCDLGHNILVLGSNLISLSNLLDFCDSFHFDLKQT